LAPGRTTLPPTAALFTSASHGLTVRPAPRYSPPPRPSAPTPTAGTSFTAPLTAHDLYDNVATSYTGSKTITWSALATSPAPASQAPKCTRLNVSHLAAANTAPPPTNAYAGGPNPHTATDAGGKTGSASL